MSRLLDWVAETQARTDAATMLILFATVPGTVVLTVVLNLLWPR